jgi:hypothetical protein
MEIDALSQKDLETILRSVRPDLVINAASLLSPWVTLNRVDPAAAAVKRAGFSVEVPAQLPILMTLMLAMREVGCSAPVANFAYPDLLHAMLAPLGLAPTIGLGNAAILWLRTRSNLRNRLARDHRDEGLPLVRVVGQLCHVSAVYAGRMPSDSEPRCEVYVGDDGVRDDSAAYEGAPMEVTMPVVTAITAVSALPVLKALMFEEDAIRISTPAPHGLPGGYPVRVSPGGVMLDLPPHMTRSDVERRQWEVLRRDGVEKVDDSGTLFFTEAARDAVSAIDPGLCEPIAPEHAFARLQRLRAVLA